METKDRIDAFGAVSLTCFAAFLAFNQVVIKFVNAGIQPVFFAGLRSGVALICLWVWLVWRGRSPKLDRRMMVPGIAIGLVFSAEFLCLFLALDLTTVTRSAIILYSMPVWMAIGAHFFMPGDRITWVKAAGLLLAFGGVILAIGHRSEDAGQAGLLGDFFALIAAICWAALALIARGTRFREVRPEMQLYWQVLVSAPVLILAAPLFGPLIRDLQPIHVAGVLFQGAVVVAAGFMFWLWILSIYPASGVTSFSFLTPIFGVAFGWALLGEEVGLPLIIAVVLVAVGILLINRPPGAKARPPA
ncbi:MAG: DMT family transporter [Albidovulum sp.]